MKRKADEKKGVIKISVLSLSEVRVSSIVLLLKSWAEGGKEQTALNSCSPKCLVICPWMELEKAVTHV